MRKAMTAMIMAGGVIATAMVGDQGVAQLNPTAPRMAISVLNQAGQPVVGAVVCAGANMGGAEWGGGVTGPAGNVMITLDNFEPDPIRPRPITVTGGNGTAGASITMAGPGSVTIRLPASGGARCPASAATSSNNSSPIAINRNVLNRDLANSRAANAGNMIPRVGTISLISEKCFGAVGMACGDWLQGQVSTCSTITGNCTINVGSWRHDQCCVAHSNGGVCKLNPIQPLARGGFSSADTICQADFDMAAQRFAIGMNWERRVDQTKVNRTGIVDHADFCAPAGTRMMDGEADYCCSRRVRMATPPEQVIPAALRQLITSINIMRICE